MRIIRPGHGKLTAYRGECYHCSCIFEIEPERTRVWWWWFSVRACDCPCCRRTVTDLTPVHEPPPERKFILPQGGSGTARPTT
jgi:hypothetical protein